MLSVLYSRLLAGYPPRPRRSLLRGYSWLTPSRALCPQDPKKSREAKFEDVNDNDAKKPSTGVVQYFLRDPDGYYVEICNCDILTKFCLSQENVDLEYDEGAKDIGFAVICVQLKWRQKVRKAKSQSVLSVEAATKGCERAAEAEPETLRNLVRRSNTYGCITQGFTEDELAEALRLSGNTVKIALQILHVWRGDDEVFQPPAFIEDGKLVKPPKIVRSKAEVSAIRAKMSAKHLVA